MSVVPAPTKKPIHTPPFSQSYLLFVLMQVESCWEPGDELVRTPN